MDDIPTSLLPFDFGYKVIGICKILSTQISAGCKWFPRNYETGVSKWISTD